jgi:CheY-like chemotaxis protein
MQATPQQISIRPTKILIVEDHHDSREALSALLRAFGYDVVEAINGREAILRAASDRPGLILMDIMMPELDGFNAARAIRAIPGLERTPIIAVTAIDDGEELALQAGMTDYVCKPVDIQKLLAKVSGWIKTTAA